MTENDKRLVEFQKLNFVGKMIFITGTAFRIVGDLLESAVDTADGIISGAERAFMEGLDPNIDEAKIVDESAQDD